MLRIHDFRSIHPIPSRSLPPGIRHAISQAARRTAVVIACCLAVLIGLRAAAADTASDREMADRYEQAAQAGDDEAQFYLGALHSAGIGRPRSDAEAFRWFLRATEQGHSHAMLIVAGLYASGRGITKDNAKAYSWAYIVESAGKIEEYRNGARQLMSHLMKKMTSDEIGHAVVAARAWRAVPANRVLKALNIERAADASPDQPAPAAPPPAPAVVQPAPPAPSPAVPQPAPPDAGALTAPPRIAPAAPAKNAKRDDVQDLLDQVPQSLRKRFGF